MMLNIFKKVLATALLTLLSITFLSFIAAQDSHPYIAKEEQGKPLANFDTDLFTGSGNCAVCHTRLQDRDGQDISIDSHWRSTMMANASKDPLWLAKVSSEIKLNPALKEVIEDKCSTCHMPMAHTQAKVDGLSTAIFKSGFLSDQNNLHEAALDGVSCTVCHQIENDNLGTEESFSGGYSIDSTRQKPNRIIYGPFTRLRGAPMQGLVGFIPMYGAQTLKSELCATCHTLFTPFVDKDGVIKGTFPEQTAFLEWQNSNFSKNSSCQECHMPAVDGAVKITNLPGGMFRSHSPFARHHFVGGNAFMLELLKKNIKKLGLTASEEFFENTIERTRLQLQNNAADLKILKVSRSANEISLKLLVTNKAGHKLPTGFPSRRAWIQVVVTDSDGKIVFNSGNYDNTGKILENDADNDPDSYEPHYQTIDSDTQVQIYESMMINYEGEITHTLLRGAEYIKDNRLLPEGFNKKKVPDEIKVYGAAAKDKNFKGGADTIEYHVNIAGYTAPFTISAKLLYQSLSFAFYTDLKSAGTKESRKFARMYRKVDNIPVVMAEAEQTVN